MEISRVTAAGLKTIMIEGSNLDLSGLTNNYDIMRRIVGEEPARRMIYVTLVFMTTPKETTKLFRNFPEVSVHRFQQQHWARLCFVTMSLRQWRDYFETPPIGLEADMKKAREILIQDYPNVF